MVQLRTPTSTPTSTPTKSWTMIFSKYSIAATLLATITGCAKPVPFQHMPVGVLPINSFERHWFIDMDLAKDPVVNLDVRDKTVYVTTTSKRVIGFDRVAGTLKFSMQVKSPLPRLMRLVELSDKLIYPNPLSIEVFDDKGIFDRSIPLPTPLRSNVSGDNQTIYFGSAGLHGGLVESYDLSQPYALKRWEFLTHDGAEVTSGTVDFNGIIYSGSTLGEVDAVNSNRDQIWPTDHGNFLVSGPITADLYVDDSGVYVASEDSKLYCINRSTGKLKWQYFAGIPLVETPFVSPDTVYEYVRSMGLVALDKNKGEFNRTPRWVNPTATQFLSQDEKYAYLADPRPSLLDPDRPGFAIIAVDKLTGKKVFESSHKDFAVFGSNRRDPTIYAAMADGKIFAITPVIKGGQIGEMVMSEISPTIARTN